MPSLKTSVVIGLSTATLLAFAAVSLAQLGTTGVEIPTSTCAPANCSNCMQQKRPLCPICCDPNDPHHVSPAHTEICYSFKHQNSTTSTGVWCITAGSATQKCKYLTYVPGQSACGNVLLWHCFPCLKPGENCGNCPCTPDGHDMTVPMGIGTQTCTDV